MKSLILALLVGVSSAWAIDVDYGPTQAGTTLSAACIKTPDSDASTLAAGCDGPSVTMKSSTLTVGGNAFSVGGSTLVVSNGRLGIGTSASYPLDVSGAGFTLANFARSDSGGSQFILTASGQGVGLNSKAIRNVGGVLSLGRYTDNLATFTGQLFLDNDDGITILSTLTVSGNAFSVGASTLSVSNGKVGIGTTSPGQKLDVAGNILALGGDVSVYHDNGGAGAGYAFRGYTRGTGGAGVQQNVTAIQMVQETSSVQSGYIGFETANAGAPGEKVRITAAGKVGIGDTSPAEALEVNGSAIAGSFYSTGTLRQGTVLSCTLGLTTDAAGSITGCVSSDGKLKTSIKAFSNSGAIIDGLMPKLYTWKPETKRDKQQHAGFIAQEVEKILPQAVVSAGKDIKGVDPNAILAAAVAEIQALRRRIAELERRK